MTQTPGWYPNPQNPSEERWWDGQNWTTNVREPQAHVPQGKGSTKWLAVAAVVLVAALGGVGLFVLGGEKDKPQEVVRGQLSLVDACVKLDSLNGVNSAEYDELKERDEPDLTEQDVKRYYELSELGARDTVDAMIDVVLALKNEPGADAETLQQVADDMIAAQKPVLIVLERAKKENLPISEFEQQLAGPASLLAFTLPSLLMEVAPLVQDIPECKSAFQTGS